MKLALNGALTVGTLDGANVELREAVGPENFFLFGHNVDQVRALYQAGYDPSAFIARSQALAEALHLVESGFLCMGDRVRYAPVVESLRRGDHYMVCADFAPFVHAMKDVAKLYASPREWARRVAFNVAGAGGFSSDATIRAYAREIWSITPIKAELDAESDAP